MFIFRYGFLFTLLFAAVLVAEGIPYSVTFLGVEGALKQNLEEASGLIFFKENPPSALAALRRRAGNDVPTLLRVLHNEGFYDAGIETRFNTSDGGYVVEMVVTKGVRYTFIDPLITVPCEDDYCETVLNSLRSLDLALVGLFYGEPALAKSVIEGRGHLMFRLGELGFPLPELVEEKVIVNRRNKTVRVVYVIDPGPEATMGCVTILGLERVMEEFVLDKICWQEGEIFHPKPLAQLELELQSSPLFSFVRVSTADRVAKDGSIPILIKAVEAKHRSIGAGLSYSSQQGAGISGEWEDRNLFGRGEHLSVYTHLWHRLQNGMISYRRPDFLCYDQTLITLLEYKQEDTESYLEKSTTASILLEKELSSCQSLTYGLALEQLESSKSDDEGTYTLFKLPLYYTWNNANDLLDPTRGSKLLLRFVPTQDLRDGDLQYTMTMATGILYLPFNDNCNNVLASKVVFGSLAGAERIEIPAPERFYTGNEHTLRGYSYLSVSPIIDNKLVGGRSMLVGSFEWRHRLNENWGWVGFYEVGNVYLDPFPDFKGKQLQSAGFGVRYFTPVGPLRLDLAFPINRRRAFDDAFQVYFSIGQAF